MKSLPGQSVQFLSHYRIQACSSLALGAAIDRIPNNGVAPITKVDPDLVGSTS